MPKDRFVSGDIVRRDLSEGDWIEIKEELGVGEQKKLEGSPMSGVKNIEDAQNREIGLDWSKFYITKLETWLVDWSFRDKQGKKVPCTADAIRALKPNDAKEIMDEINVYIEEQEKKKAEPSTKTTSAAAS